MTIRIRPCLTKSLASFDSDRPPAIRAGGRPVRLSPPDWRWEPLRVLTRPTILRVHRDFAVVLDGLARDRFPPGER